MPLKKSAGNMYDWVTHTHSHLAGKCSHACEYCYVQAMERKFSMGKYVGQVHLVPKELDVDYGSGKTIFIEHMNDLFARDVSPATIMQVLAHCQAYPDNTYVFQTKNPARYMHFIGAMPQEAVLGTTIESDIWFPTVMGNTPSPVERYKAMMHIPHCFNTFVTVEPIMQCSPAVLADWIRQINPQFVNIGADSKGTGLPEPSRMQVEMLLSELKRHRVHVNQKTNLGRLLK